MKYGVILCLYQNKEHRVPVAIAGALMMHSRLKTWFNAAIVVKKGCLIAFAQTVVIIKAVKY
jgi:hypothetical protein